MANVLTGITYKYSTVVISPALIVLILSSYTNPTDLTTLPILNSAGEPLRDGVTDVRACVSFLSLITVLGLGAHVSSPSSA